MVVVAAAATAAVMVIEVAAAAVPVIQDCVKKNRTLRYSTTSS